MHNLLRYGTFANCHELMRCGMVVINARRHSLDAARFNIDIGLHGIEPTGRGVKIFWLAAHGFLLEKPQQPAQLRSGTGSAAKLRQQVRLEYSCGAKDTGSRAMTAAPDGVAVGRVELCPGAGSMSCRYCARLRRVV